MPTKKAGFAQKELKRHTLIDRNIYRKSHPLRTFNWAGSTALKRIAIPILGTQRTTSPYTATVEPMYVNVSDTTDRTGKSLGVSTKQPPALKLAVCPRTVLPDVRSVISAETLSSERAGRGVRISIFRGSPFKGDEEKIRNRPGGWPSLCGADSSAGQ